MLLKTLLLIGSGGFLGSIARFGIQLWVLNIFHKPFPLGTLIVNVTGCFIIGIIWGFTQKPFEIGNSWRFFLATGFCGGFTTFSTFSMENITLLKQGEIMQFFIYTSLSLVLGLLAVLAGYFIARSIAAVN